MLSFILPVLKLLQKHEFEVSQGSVDALFRRAKTFILLCGKYIQGNMYTILAESVGFSRRCDKNILVCFFRFTVPIAVHLQNSNAKFHKVVQRHYSGEV